MSMDTFLNYWVSLQIVNRWSYSAKTLLQRLADRSPLGYNAEFPEKIKSLNIQWSKFPQVKLFWRKRTRTFLG